ncbi:uncharacterized protein LOC115080641 isoform X1 [Rhinatrema bivittatum]|uniref:uncharacterized protein LOC115080641 isoform X1 n=1 Tax=Rhinatrema bivittatum TaxID=194408 RepID=UPI0011295E1B|nr:uncharacterized protein LOC115080641 isoform X1 [Rhinatrema bivittatum]
MSSGLAGSASFLQHRKLPQALWLQSLTGKLLLLLDADEIFASSSNKSILPSPLTVLLSCLLLLFSLPSFVIHFALPSSVPFLVTVLSSSCPSLFFALHPLLFFPLFLHLLLFSLSSSVTFLSSFLCCNYLSLFPLFLSHYSYLFFPLSFFPLFLSLSLFLFLPSPVDISSIASYVTVLISSLIAVLFVTFSSLPSSVTVISSFFCCCSYFSSSAAVFIFLLSLFLSLPYSTHFSYLFSLSSFLSHCSSLFSLCSSFLTSFLCHFSPSVALSSLPPSVTLLISSPSVALSSLPPSLFLSLLPLQLFPLFLRHCSYLFSLCSSFLSSSVCHCYLFSLCSSFLSSSVCHCSYLFSLCSSFLSSSLCHCSYLFSLCSSFLSSFLWSLFLSLLPL